MAGAQDNASSRGTDLNGVNGWALFSTGDGTAVGVDPADVNLIFESTQHLSLRRSVNGGTLVSAVAGITETSANFPFVPYLAMDPGEGRRLYLGGTSNLWRSLDSGATWTRPGAVLARSRYRPSIQIPFCLASNSATFTGTPPRLPPTGPRHGAMRARAVDSSPRWPSIRPIPTSFTQAIPHSSRRFIRPTPTFTRASMAASRGSPPTAPEPALCRMFRPIRWW